MYQYNDKYLETGILPSFKTSSICYTS